MRIIVTGAAGFLGKVVWSEAFGAGYEVRAVVRPSELALVAPDTPVDVCDWTTSTALAELFCEYRPDAVVHCAGAPPRGYAAGDTALLYEANAALLWRLLEGVKDSGVRPRIVSVSSSAVYSPLAATPISEDAVLAPASHYGRSKLVGEQVVAAFRDLDGLDAVVARPFNLLGPCEPEGSVVRRVADQLRALSNEEPRRIHLRETKSVRDFVDVRDAAAALLVLASTPEPPLYANICTGRGTSILELVELAAVAWGLDSVEVEVDEEPEEASVSVGDPRTLTDLGWAPRLTLGQTLTDIARAR